MKKNPDSLLQRLEERKEINALRTLMDRHDLVDFYSNDYLGLAKWQMQGDFAQGSTGSRLISGNTLRTEQIEQELARFFGFSSGILFNSGYDANLGLFSSVLQKGDTVIYDQFIHASIHDGIRLSQATAFSFEHNNLDALEKKLSRTTGNCYVAVEGIYSMNGDEAPLIEISAMCEKYKAFLIVDEAHAGGVVGDQGEGLTSKLGLDHKVFAKLIAFGKAYGSHGGLVLGTPELKSYLVNFARSFIYTTALSPHSQERISAAVKKSAAAKTDRLQLSKNIDHFRKRMEQSKMECLASSSPIQIVMCPGNGTAKNLAQKILSAGFAVKAILNPTVPKGAERLRICIHSYNTESEIYELVEAING